MTKRITRPKLPVGRPSSYEPSFADKAFKLCLLGATDEDIADVLGVSTACLNQWKAFPDFKEAFTRGKMQADAEVAHSLRQRALGYSHEAVKVFMPAGAGAPVYAPYVEHYPPDTAAASLWLRNRQPKFWRDRTDVTHSGTIGLEHWIAESYQKGQPAIEGTAREVEDDEA